MKRTRISGILAVLIATSVSCGGSASGDDQSTPDAKVKHDAPETQLDAGSGSNPGSGSGSNVTNGIGLTCTAGSNAESQGSCPTGFVCLDLQGGTNPYCTKTCTQGSNDTCATGYTGPGLAECITGIQGSDTTYCGVICEDDTSTHEICPASKCNDTCPGSLACSEELQAEGSNGSAMNVGKACN